MGLFFSSLCLGIGLCRMNLSVALGCVYPEQWKATPAADASLVHVLSFMGGKSLCSVSCLLESLIVKEKTRSQILYCRNGLQRGGLRKRSSKMHISVILCNIAVGVVKSLFSPRAAVRVFQLCVFCWGVGKRTRRRATQSSNPKRRRLRQMAWNQARHMSSRSEPGQLPATVASAEDLSLKPAQCVSPFNYCQPMSLERLPITSQGIDTFAESSALSWPHLLTLETPGTSWPCTRQANTSVLASSTHTVRRELKSGHLQAPEIHSVPCLEKSCIYESWCKRGQGPSLEGQGGWYLLLCTS